MQAAGVEIVATPFVPTTVAEQEAMAQALLEMVDKIMAMKFLRKLDRKRYGNWLDNLENELNEGRDIYPKKLIEAYQQANGRRENRKIVANMTSQRQQHQAIALIADKKNDIDDKTGADDKKSATGKKKTSNKSKKSFSADSTDSSLSRVICHVCDEAGHLQYHCPIVKKAIAEITKKKQGSAVVAYTQQDDDHWVWFFPNYNFCTLPPRFFPSLTSHIFKFTLSLT
jgi:hypothetical protein